MNRSSEDDSEDEDFKMMSTKEQMLAMIPWSLDGTCDIEDLESNSDEFNLRLNPDGFLDESNSNGDDDCKRMSDSKKAPSESDNSELEPEPEKSKRSKQQEHSDNSEESPLKQSKSNSPAEEMYESDASLPQSSPMENALAPPCSGRG